MANVSLTICDRHVKPESVDTVLAPPSPEELCLERVWGLVRTLEARIWVAGLRGWSSTPSGFSKLCRFSLKSDKS